MASCAIGRRLHCAYEYYRDFKKRFKMLNKKEVGVLLLSDCKTSYKSVAPKIE